MSPSPGYLQKGVRSMSKCISNVGLEIVHGWWGHPCGHGAPPGVSMCLPHECQLCGAILRVNHLGTPSLHCGRSMGCHPRHAVVNDLINRSLASAKISAQLELVGICLTDGRQPDGASVMPWRSGWLCVYMGCHVPGHICTVSLAVDCHRSWCGDRPGQAEEKGHIHWASHQPPLHSGGYQDHWCLQTGGTWVLSRPWSLNYIGRSQRATILQLPPFNESQLQCKGRTQPPWWAPPSPEHLIPTLTM